MELVQCVIPFFVWLNVDVTNDIDVCKFYPKFAQKGSHSGKHKRETLRHCLFNYFQSKSFLFKISKVIMSSFSLAFRQRLCLVFDFHYST